MLRFLFRPTALIAVSVLLVGAASLVLLRSGSESVPPRRLPLRGGDQEVAFIYPATSTAWDRFAAAVRRASGRLQRDFPGLKVRESAAASDDIGTTTPEIVLEWPGSSRRLVFRWYKLTSDWTPQAWMKELLRPPYPLAVVGGSNTHWARELAVHMRDAGERLPEEARPLLLVTTATADHVTLTDRSGDAGVKVPLTDLYPERTYRFCFSNRQMATAVTRFIWTQPDLRPQDDPAYLVQWMDDSYSRDLIDEYIRVLDYRAADDVLQQAAFVAGCLGTGVPPMALAGWVTSGLRHEGGGLPLRIPSSVGSFAWPNPYEAESCRHLITDLVGRQRTARMSRLLVLTGQAQPSRRFLRDLARSSPNSSRQLVVATGDAIPFNYVYRDRLVMWPIQDLPFRFVFFCHRNPIDPEAGFRPLDPQGMANVSRPGSHSETTDLLLFADIVESLALARGDGSEICNASDLARALDELHFDNGELTREERGQRLFNPQTRSRNGSTGEHVVCLRPRIESSRVLPEAILEVWCRESVGTKRVWRRVGEPLNVSYIERKAHGERGHVND